MVSGRIAGIAVDPTSDSTIYVAAAGGGVWKTTDGGTTWTALTDTMNSLAMGAIAVAPSNHLKIYAGTGEANNAGDSNFGRGILVSGDGGGTWTLATGPGGVFDRLAIAQISVNPTDATIAYAAVNDFAENGLCCANTGIYKTTDGGATWTNVTAANSKDATLPWSAVVVDPNTPTTVYAAHGDCCSGPSSNGIYRSTDSGSTWTLLTGTNAPSGSGTGRYALAVAPSASTATHHVLYVAVSDPFACFGSLLKMLRSDNADDTTPTFTDLTSGTPDFLGGGNGCGAGQGWYDITLGVDPANSAIVYAAGVVTYSSNTNAVIRSTTSGASWTDITHIGLIQPHTDSHAIAVDSTGRMLLGNDGGIWRYESVTPSWTDLNGNLNTIQFTGIDLHPTNPLIAGGGSQDNGTEKFTGSLLWSEVIGGDGGVFHISQTTPTRWYHTFAGASFQRSDDSGATWADKTAGWISESSNFYQPFNVDPSNGDHLLTGLIHVYETTNAADLWVPIATSGSGGFTSGGAAVDAVAIAPGTSPATLYAATGGTFASTSKIFVTTNDGALWTERDLGVGGRVNEIDVDPNDATGATAFAVVNTFNGASGQVFKTTNFGGIWTNISGDLPALPTWSLKVDTNASHTVYVSNETGVYSSTSPYATWTAVGTGLPNAQGVDLELNRGLHLLAVGKHGRGAWELLTQNATVTNVTSSTPNGTYTVAAVISIQVTFNENVTVTGTPQLALNSGGTASYASGSGTNTLTFTYTVAGGQNSALLDYTSTSALTLNGGTINDPTATPAVLTLAAPGAAGSLSANKTIVIDTVAPTVVAYKVLFGSSSYNLIGSGRTRLPWTIAGIQVTFSKTIPTADMASLTGLSVSGLSGLGTSTLTWTISSVTNITASTALVASGADAIKDVAGNALNGGTNFLQTVKVLCGDYNDDGVVSAADLAGVNAARFAPYNILADISGDGVVNTADVGIVRTQVGHTNP